MTELAKTLDQISARIIEFENEMLAKYIPITCAHCISWDDGEDSLIGIAKIDGRWRLAYWRCEEDYPIPVSALPIEERLDVLSKSPFPFVEEELKRVQDVAAETAQAVLNSLG